jgi:hypothetical protein
MDDYKGLDPDSLFCNGMKVVANSLQGPGFGTSRLWVRYKTP